MKTKPGRVTLAIAAEHINLSARAFNFLIEAGVIPRQAPNIGYVLDEVRTRYIKNLRMRASGQGDGAANLAKARAQLAEAQTTAARIKNAVLVAEVVHVRDVKAIVETEYATIREGFLSAPGANSNTIAFAARGAVSIEAATALVEGLLTDVIVEILENLSAPDNLAGKAADRQKGYRR